jgi:caa(3)-type oxidase subunit IV
MIAYVLTWISLVALATLSLCVASTPAIAFGIASVKAVLVAAVFMKLATERGTPRIALALAFAFLALLILGVMGDIGTRDLASAYVHH